MNTRKFGDKYEELASNFLAEKGYIILDRNYRMGRSGEIDIVAKTDEYICFIEVKSRTSNRFGYPSEAVGYKKQETIRRVSQCFLKQKGFFNYCVRYDVIEILNGKVNHITNAF